MEEMVKISLFLPRFQATWQ